MTRSIRSAWARAAVVLAAASVFAVPAGAAKTDTWVAKTLKNPSRWAQVYPNAINRRGEVVGLYVEDATSPPHAVRWPDPSSDPVELPEIPGSPYSNAISINDRGQVAGFSGERAVIWDRRGAITKLHERLTGFDGSRAAAVNARGDVAGLGVLSSNGTWRAVFWPKKGPAVTLPMDDTLYLSTQTWAMNGRGTVCGTAQLLPSGQPEHAAYWPRGGDLIDLHWKVKEAMPTAQATAALKVLDGGQIAGVAWETEALETNPPIQKGWVYEPRTRSVRLVDDGGAGIAVAWGSALGNRFVGFLDGDGSQSGLGPTRPAFWKRGKVHGETSWTLMLLPVPPGLVGFSFGNGNAKGVLIGWGTADDGTVRGGIARRSPR